MPPLLRSNAALNHAKMLYLDMLIEQSTREVYNSGYNAYTLFMLMSNASIECPPNEDILVYFVVHCASKLKLKYSTIKCYLSGIRHFYLCKGYNNPLGACGADLHDFYDPSCFVCRQV